MNIFVLDQGPYAAAGYHCDKHVVKMILEYGQMLSTSHRLLDAKPKVVADPENRRKPKRFWLFANEYPELVEVKDKEGLTKFKWQVENAKCYQVAHANHPCSVWTRESDSNYYWLYQLFDGCLREYERRYFKSHRATSLKEFLSRSPRNIKRGPQTPFALAMPEEYKHEDAVEAYRRFYAGSKVRFAKWKNTPVPDWFKYRVEGQNVTNL